MIVRDLWAYQLALSPLPSPPGAIERTTSAEQDEEDEGKDATENEKTDDKGDEEDDSDDSSDGQSEKGDVDLEDDILAELSDHSKGSEDESDQRKEPSGGGKGPPWKRRRRLRVSDTLVTIITALWILRIPIVNVDVQS